jgi:hypothetical protein
MLFQLVQETNIISLPAQNLDALAMVPQALSVFNNIQRKIKVKEHVDS